MSYLLTTAGHNIKKSTCSSRLDSSRNTLYKRVSIDITIVSAVESRSWVNTDIKTNFVLLVGESWWTIPAPPALLIEGGQPNTGRTRRISLRLVIIKKKYLSYPNPKYLLTLFCFLCTSWNHDNFGLWQRLFRKMSISCQRSQENPIDQGSIGKLHIVP